MTPNNITVIIDSDAFVEIGTRDINL